MTLRVEPLVGEMFDLCCAHLALVSKLTWKGVLMFGRSGGSDPWLGMTSDLCSGCPTLVSGAEVDQFVWTLSFFEMLSPNREYGDDAFCVVPPLLKRDLDYVQR